MINYGQSIQDFIVPAGSVPNKISALNFSTVKDKDTSSGYSAAVLLPVEELPPAPIPTPPPAQKVIEANDEHLPYYVIVDVEQQLVSIMTRDEDGDFSVVYRQFYCSSGVNNTPTLIGNFKIRKVHPWLISYPSETVTGEEYRVYARYRTTIIDDYHFHSILYEDYRGFDTLKRSSFYKIGTKASHGCVRLLVRDAKWLYTHCAVGTPISIIKRGGPALDRSKFQEVPYYRDLPKGVTYDPTDLTFVNKLGLD